MRRRNNIRNYEVSIWTLQDSFITVLKQSNLENKEKIQEPKMVLKDDGENTFSFKIPMYLYNTDIFQQATSDITGYTQLSVSRDNSLPIIHFFSSANGNILNFEYDRENTRINVNSEENLDNKVINFTNSGQIIEINTSRQVPHKKQWIENPIWYTTRNGNIIANMRKVKVIFNKNDKDEEVFEFIITKVTEKHEGYSKYCEVECNGLAFHELGKQGYEISLSQKNMIAEAEEYYQGNNEYSEMPRQTLDYWVKKVLDGTDWEYIVYMNWAASDGYLELDHGLNWYLNQTQEERDNYNNTREENNLRRCDKIYHDPYVSSWKESNNILIAATEVTDLTQLEKLATVEGKNSNRYNLLQSIAEAFGVFCKFQYLYDDNYHIIGRRVIFYNNFISEENGFIDFTFGYNTSQLSRDIDSNDLVSKMYVSSLTDTGMLSGSVSISQSLANPSRENYLLNFDYLHQIQTISEEQYQAIKNFQAQLRKYNTEYYNIYEHISLLQLQITELEADLKTAQEYHTKAEQERATAEQLISAMTDGKTKEPERFTLYHDYITSSSKSHCLVPTHFSGLIPNTLHLYQDKELTKEISLTLLEFTYNENNLITRFSLPEHLAKDLTSVYAMFEYTPNLWSETLQNMWGGIALEQEILIKKIEDELGVKESENELDTEEKLGKHKQLEELQKQGAALLEAKTELKMQFEKLMGPALREGNWQPDDKYANYQMFGSYALDFQSLVNNTEQGDTDGIVRFNWYPKMFKEELELKYHYDMEQAHDRYYPCISLENINISDWKNRNINLVYTDIYVTNNAESAHDPRNQHYLALGADNGCDFCFLRSKYGSKRIIPALVITGARYILDTTVNNTFYSSHTLIQNNARISDIQYTEVEALTEIELISDLNNRWINDPQNYELVYPRFSINNTNYIKNSPEHQVSYGSQQLEANQDYYTLYQDFYYYTTIKPQFAAYNLNETYTFYYNLSTAAEAIYLDAIEVLKENSFPKVSYSISPIAINESVIHNAYAQLGRLAHINDPELQFENVQGYISEVNLDLDKPWEDTYTIKNYKTKFEDLFSTIVAQTEEMKRNSTLMSMTSNLFDSNGNINAELLTNSLLNAHIDQLIKDVAPSALQLTTLENSLQLSNSTAVKIMNGEVGLAFQSAQINNLQLNNEVGLLLEGTLSNDANDLGFFRVTNGAMGFFRGTNQNRGEGLLYFENGDLVVKGQVKAGSGWFGNDEGWIISSTYPEQGNAIYEGGLLYSKNNKIILYAGNNKIGSEYKSPAFLLYGNNNEELLKFQNNTLTVKGAIYATSLYIGNFSADEYFQNAQDLSPYAILKVDQVDGIQLETGNGQSFGGVNAAIKLFDDKIDVSGGSINLTGDSQINLTGGSINLSGGSINIYSSGQINMTKGRIGGTRANDGTWSGGWIIDTNKIYSGSNNPSSANSGDVTLSSGDFSRQINNSNITGLRFAIGGNFGVTNSGTLYANGVNISGIINAETGGKIGGWNIDTNGIIGDPIHPYVLLSNGNWSTTPDANKTTTVKLLNGSGQHSDVLVVQVNENDQPSWPFVLTASGYLLANNAEIKGQITATSGSFGDGTNKIQIGTNGVNNINSAIYSGKQTLTTNTNGFYIGTNGIALGPQTTINDTIVSKFQVNPDGTVYASGNIIATSGRIGGWNIQGGSLVSTSAGSSITLSHTDNSKFKGFFSGTGIKLNTEDNKNIFEVSLDSVNKTYIEDSTLTIAKFVSLQNISLIFEATQKDANVDWSSHFVINMKHMRAQIDYINLKDTDKNINNLITLRTYGGSSGSFDSWTEVSNYIGLISTYNGIILEAGDGDAFIRIRPQSNNETTGRIYLTGKIYYRLNKTDSYQSFN